MKVGILGILIGIACLTAMESLAAQEQKRSSADVSNVMYNEINKLGLVNNEIKISSSHYSDHNEVHYVYLQQVYQDIDIWGAQGNLVIRDKVLVSNTDKLILDIPSKVKHIKKNLSTQEIVSRVASYLDLSFEKSLGSVSFIGNDSYKVSDLPYAEKDVIVKPIWSLWEESYYKSWEVRLKSNLGPEDYIVIVNGYTGKVAEVVNRTISCQFDQEHSHAPETESKKILKESSSDNTVNFNIGDGQYRVFPVPVESPNHGDRTLVDSPADEQASPFGWHDTNRAQGAEFTITRGNNVHTYHDQSADNESEGDEPDGGDKLVFDFPFDRDASVRDNLDADATNLFYWNNFIHDWSYKFGFNESAGNFQSNNYGNGGRGQDFVRAETLDGEDTGNANFSAPEDGSNGRMQMYRWIIGGEFEVTNPISIGDAYPSTVSNFGPAFKPQVNGTIAIAQDAVDELGDVCEPITNASALDGQVALVDRGICDFSEKVYSVQQAGAVACIVCNNLLDAPLVSMGAGENAAFVEIPAIFIAREDCQLIKDAVNAGQSVSVFIDKTVEVSSALDNGIVAHEYGHGISLRLVGGANTTNCLTNDEQMGEGWSDFFGLVLTRTPEDRASDPRGVGTYALGEGVDGRGIRRYQYSTDMTINPQTMSHIRATSTDHPVGEVWMTALWDMYWLYIDAYGYDATWEDRSSGNFRAVQNVMDGMKIQPCNASLLEARDAILTADALNYLNEGECLIWQAFARRGMGVDADGGNANWRYDNIDGFELPTGCRSLPYITRTATPIIEVGDEIEVTIAFETNSVALSDMVITDLVPSLADPGLRFGEVLTDNVQADVDGNTITFSFGSAVDQSLSSISYTLRTQGLSPPNFDLYENFEGENEFDFTTSTQEVEDWRISSSIAAEGQFSLRVAGNLKEGVAYATLSRPIQITDDNSILRFDNRYEAQLGFDGGQVEISEDNGVTWTQIPESDLLVQPYKDRITYDFRYTRTEAAFTGVDTLWNTSIVDLSSYNGSDILFRFAYVQQDFLEIEPYEGWSLDNVEIFDRLEITGSVCLKVNGQADVCDVSSTYVSSNARTTPTIDILNDIRPMVLTPNPAGDYIWATFSSEKSEVANLRVITIDGKVLHSESIQIKDGQNNLNKDLSGLASGTYILEIRSNSGSLNQKFIKQ
jgi:extracellular elastinolytic metalloproteinase